ncbi:MAG: hypothetical protein QOG79_5601, partial [Mycobacterium sp.]|nr:hypothetical protein [Mycobacterium sp.]
MSTSTVVAQRFPRITHGTRGAVDRVERIGAQAQFYARTLVSVGDAVTRYPA